ncbi:X-box-binding protein 1 isoform X2 [Atheta coriaria]|uniref:X-box-binding protein 1 isoform X2 n=1 Tax=Dalotia coriaria TaxID=877792 RepID=UPI0031F33C07
MCIELENEHRHFIVLEENTEDAYMDSLVKPRKRRLDHLTWEEKIQRKKLKNRVAAQTSRDRKKAKMDLLEESFDKLMAQNKRVLAECENLKKLNETLRNENMELRQSLRQSTCPNCDSCSHHHQNRRVECDGHLSGSAASEFLLQQQGVAPHSAAALMSWSSSSLIALKILLACLLCKTSSTSSTKMSILAAWMSSQQASLLTSPTTLMQWVKMLNLNWHQFEFVIMKRLRTQLVNPVILDKWWGRHQNNWNPLEMARA